MTVNPSEESLWLLASSLDIKPEEFKRELGVKDQAIRRISSDIFIGYEDFYAKNKGAVIDNKKFAKIAERTFQLLQKDQIALNPNILRRIQEKIDLLTQNADKREIHLNASWIGTISLLAQQVVNWVFGYGLKTDAQYYHEAAADIKFRSNFEFSEGGTKLTLNQAGKKNLTDQDIEEIFKHLSPEEKSKIEKIDLSGAKNITYKTLVVIGNELNLFDITFQDCKHLMENDDIKGYIEAFFADEKIHSKSCHQKILNSIGTTNFNMGTEPHYAQEQKYHFAKEYALAQLASKGSSWFTTGVIQNRYDNFCFRLILEDLIDHKVSDDQGSVNGARRSTLTAQDVQILKALSSLPDSELTKLDIGNLTLHDKFYKRSRDLIEVFNARKEAFIRDCPLRQLNQIYLPQSYRNKPLSNILEDLKSQNPDTRMQAARAAVIVKAQFIEYGQYQGRFFSLNDFLKIAKECDDCFTKSQLNDFEAMTHLSETFSQEIDEATLEWIMNEHLRFSNHPVVGIIGGGPTGLFAALEFYSKGANVQLTEERDAAYIRHQIVRLDPLWVAKLKFYLGTKFEQYFGSEDKVYTGDKPFIGNRSGDGFVECVINHLENRLSQRVIELESYVMTKSKEANAFSFSRLFSRLFSYSNKPESDSVQMFAAHSVSPDFTQNQEGKYLLTRDFVPERAKLRLEEVGGEVLAVGGIHGPDQTNVAKKQQLAVDLVFDVAGKHSPIREANTAFIDKTEERPHTVASFFVRGDCKSYREEGHDFRRQYLVDADFIENVSSQILASITSHLDQVFKPDQENLKEEIARITQEELETFKAANFSRHAVNDGHVNDRVNSNVYETRTFINVDSKFNPDPNAPARPDNGVSRFLDDGIEHPDNIVYIGMEIPKPLDDFYKALNNRIKDRLTEGFSEKEKRAIAKGFVDEANLSFVLNVAHEQGLDRPIDGNVQSEPWVKREYADRKFLGTFMVSQGSVPTPVAFRSDDKGNKLITACGGDACATPHFMRYSGLSGGREHVDVIANLIGNVPFSDPEYEQKQLESDLQQANKRYEHINEFVLSRGKVFLPQATPIKIAENLFGEVTRLIDEADIARHYGSSEKALQALNNQLKETMEFLDNESRDNPELSQLIFDIREKINTLAS